MILLYFYQEFLRFHCALIFSVPTLLCAILFVDSVVVQKFKKIIKIINKLFNIMWIGKEKEME